jgi:Fungal specific transcription factor domain
MLQVIPDPQPTYVLIAAAIRLSHSIGLHRSLDEFGLDAAEKKLRQNVFWITYVLEVGITLRCGRPPAMSDQDIAVALPQTTSTGFDHFRCIATLSLLESRVYSELYSAKAATRSGLERLQSIGRLDAELTRWRDAMPLGYRPESEVVCLEHELTPVVMMHFSYYNCLGAIHRASIHHGSWTSAPESESSPEDHDSKNLNPRVYISSSICLEAARNVIGLLKHYNRDFPQNSLIL